MLTGKSDPEHEPRTENSCSGHDHDISVQYVLRTVIPWIPPPLEKTEFMFKTDRVNHTPVLV